jgi:Icc-related predicted phosphoesterase
MELKMRIKVVSDLHLEFSDINIKNDENCDVLILSGDIMIAQDLHDHPEPVVSPYASYAQLGRHQESAQRFRDFLKRVSFQFPHVIYIAGNHEFYHGKFIDSLRVLRDECSKFPNIYFMENDCKKIDNILFIGSTLWTDMNRGDPITLYTVANGMNDYRVIRHDGMGYTKLRPAHTLSRHRHSLEFISNTIKDNPSERVVVVSHMAPSELSINPKYKNDPHMNGAYYSDLSEFILDRPQIALWCHGHVHTPFDYTIGNTRIVCNPRGYEGYEPESGWDSKMFIEI